MLWQNQLMTELTGTSPAGQKLVCATMTLGTETMDLQVAIFEF